MAYTNNHIAVIDLETGSKNPHKTQPTQIACVIVDFQRLEIIDNSEFNSEIKPIVDPKELEKHGLDDIEDEALKITKKSLDKLLLEKPVDIVWNEFKSYINNWKKGKTPSTAPIVCGFNNNGFDDIILKRLGIKYGGYNKDKEQWEIFNPRHNIDIFKYCWMWLESKDIKSLSLDSLREYFGMSSDGAHNAMRDVYDTAEIMIRMFELFRKLSPKIAFQNCCKSERRIKK